MISRPFIDRPVLASVASMVIVLVGAISVRILPVEQYPQISPPSIKVGASFPGADAKSVAESVAAVIEQEINGAPNMLYMSSESSSSGSYSLTITFEVGTDPDLASVEIQNRVKQAEGRLPEAVVKEGISVSRQATELVQIIGVRAEGEHFDESYVFNYTDINVREAMRRIPGVGSASMYGTRPYSMRIWLDPLKLAALGLTVDDVRSAVREQNTESSGGTIGALPAEDGVDLVFPVTAVGRLSTEEEFGDIIVRVGDDGIAMVRLRDVARVELASYSYSVSSKLDGGDAALMAVYLLPGANMLTVADEVTRTLDRLSRDFPEGMEYVVAYDASRFVRESISEVVTTLWQATLLVILVVFVFLQSWRTTIVPAVAVPISLVGAFAAMVAFGFSINTFTLLALVLAIGIVVDDAIVVVENVERLMAERGMSPREATIEAMSQLSGALIATSLVLAAVFVPVSFLGGITGRLYRQFGLTITASVLLSTVVALTLSPALCALLLRPRNPDRRSWAPFRAFDRGLDGANRWYVGLLKSSLRQRALSLLVFVAIVAGVGWLFVSVPQGFIPLEDQGFFNVEIGLPEGSARERTGPVVDRAEEIFLDHPAVDHVFTRIGSSERYGSDESKGGIFVSLKPWAERGDGDTSIEGIVAAGRRELHRIPEATTSVLMPPSIPGLGESAGFQLQLLDPTGINWEGLVEAGRELAARANNDPRLEDVDILLRPEVPQYLLDLDRARAKTMGIPVGDVFSTVKSFFQRGYVNDFNKFGRVYRVSIQADAPFRRYPEDAAFFHLRSTSGEMVPIPAVASFRRETGPGSIKRFNLQTAVPMAGSPVQGRSSGQAIADMEELSAPVRASGFGLAWSGVSFQEIQAAGQTGTVLVLALVFVYLFLAAQYESWTLPIPILLLVPIAMLGALGAIGLRGTANDMFFQIGLVALIGLSAKNAILIVEFAKSLVDQGREPLEAALEAAKLRFRPILMTALSFIFGLLPLVFASGAGEHSRHSIGTGVFGGMVAASTIGLVFVPLFFVVILGRRRGSPSNPKTDEVTP
jgi:multidrug efflux pump